MPSSLSPSFPPRAGVHGEGAARAVAALALLPPALGFSVWLTLCCADFLPLERASYEAASAWLLFALHVGMGCLLPPALIGGFTRLLPREKEPVSPLLLLRESARAALLSYALFVTLFFLAAWLLQRFLPAFHPVYVPALLSRIQALVCCLLLWISWSIAVFLLLPATRHTTPPPAYASFSSWHGFWRFWDCSRPPFLHTRTVPALPEEPSAILWISSCSPPLHGCCSGTA